MSASIRSESDVSASIHLESFMGKQGIFDHNADEVQCSHNPRPSSPVQMKTLNSKTDGLLKLTQTARVRVGSSLLIPISYCSSYSLVRTSSIGRLGARHWEDTLCPDVILWTCKPMHFALSPAVPIGPSPTGLILEPASKVKPT